MSDTPTAFLFPGQGAQAVGMGQDLWASCKAAKEAFAEASEAIGVSIEKLCFEGPAEALTLTENAQPAILTVSVAAWRAIGSELGVPANTTAMAGHSLGEYSALVAAGAMGLADAARVVRARGQAMQRAVPAGKGAMAAIMGLAAEAVEALCRRASAQGAAVISPANFNAPTQIVVAGEAGAVETARALAQQAGGKAVPLEVSAPFHCALMEPAARELEAVLAGVEITAPRVPVLRNVDALPHEGADSIRAFLVRQVTAPVRWTQTVEALRERGVERFVEVGPGRVLSGLLKRIDRKLSAANVCDAESLKKLAEQPAA